MKKLKYITLALLGMVGAGIASAHEGVIAGSPPDGSRPRHGSNRAPLMRALDTDKDGAISSAEMTNAPVTLAVLDTDDDGSVSSDELKPSRPADTTAPVGTTARGESHSHPADPLMLALDANLDGDLAASEIANAARSLAALDLDKDGTLSAEELHPLPPETTSN